MDKYFRKRKVWSDEKEQENQKWCEVQRVTKRRLRDKSLLQQFDLRNLKSIRIRKQGRNTCGAHAITLGNEIVSGSHLDEEDLIHSRMIKSGEFLINLANRVNDRGIRKDKKYGETGKLRCHIRILSDINVEAMKYSIGRGEPICINTEQYNHYSTPQRLSLKGKRRHIVCLVGYYDDDQIEGGGKFIFANSHGCDWGIDGYGDISYAFASKYIHEAVICTKPT